MSISATNMALPLAIDVKGACEALGIGKNSLYQEIREGRIEIRKLGRRTLIPTAQLATWLASLPREAA